MTKEKNSLQECYDVDYLNRRTLEAIQDYRADANNEATGTITELAQTQFDYMMHAIGQALFFGFDIEKDILMLCLACSVYVDISSKYNKIVSIDGFGSFIGIDPETIRMWENDAKESKQKGLYINTIISLLQKIYTQNNYNFNDIILLYNLNITESIRSGQELVSVAHGAIFLRLQGFREYEIKNSFLSSKQQLGAVALVNREYGWSADTVAQVERQRALTLADLPRLSNYVNPQNTLETSKTSEMA